MKACKSSLLIPFLIFLFQLSSIGQPAATHTPKNNSAVGTVTANLDQLFPQLMKAADIPGITAALIRDGKMVWQKNFGVANIEAEEPVSDETIFEAASLSKIVAAYAALKLADEGKLDLDKPLNQYLGNNYDVPDDKRINLITARHVLTHSSGFPNWRPNNSTTLPIHFNPGEKFSYSGEGFVYLSKVMEKITSTPFDEYVQKVVFVPLQMKQSSFIWLDSYKKSHVYRHNWLGEKSFRWEGAGYNAAASLHTTAADYAKFVIAVLKGQGLKKATWQQMLTPQVTVNEQNPNVAWGLGLGLELTAGGKTFWHWGDQGDSKCYVTAYIDRQDAIVYFTNSANGLSVAHTILEASIGGEHPALAWLNYERYNPESKKFMIAVVDSGATVALKNYRAAREQNKDLVLSEATINKIGYILLQMKRTGDAIEVFMQNTVDFPQSSNTWDSLAEAYMIKGDKELAIQNYEKSLALNPGNTNAVEQLKKLRAQ